MDGSTTGGFGPRALHFFDALEENNSREFWTAHLDEFEREVKAPMAVLLESLPQEYQSFRMFRMNRDLRFSKDKSPYKLQHSGVLGTDGIDHYLHVGADGLLVASGIYWMERDQLERYRSSVDDGRSGKALERILADLGPAVEDETMGVASLKTAPRGYSREHPRIQLLRQKGMVAHRRLTGPGLADGARVREFVLGVFTDAKPLNAWLKRHVGQTSERTEPGRS